MHFSKFLNSQTFRTSKMQRLAEFRTLNQGIQLPRNNVEPTSIISLLKHLCTWTSQAIVRLCFILFPSDNPDTSRHRAAHVWAQAASRRRPTHMQAEAAPFMVRPQRQHGSILIPQINCLIAPPWQPPCICCQARSAPSDAVRRVLACDKPFECPICWEENVANPAIIVRCGHVLCEECLAKLVLMEWTGLESVRCPCCRGGIDGVTSWDCFRIAHVKRGRRRVEMMV
jgi:hypothetical protein